jgi:hypothetical protein
MAGCCEASGSGDKEFVTVTGLTSANCNGYL